MRSLSRYAGLIRRLARTERPIILMYHRVVEIACDPWRLAVSPARFSDQLELLSEEREVVPLSWLAGRIRDGRMPRRAAAITFDDGYADVLTNAKPLLEKHSCAATVFLTVGAIGDGKGFWWDILARMFLETPSLPRRLRLDIGGQHREWLIGQSDHPAPNEFSRREVHDVVWRELRRLGPEARAVQLQHLAAWAGIQAVSRPEDRSLTRSEARQLSAPGFIDIGAHTVSHPSLPMLDDAAKFQEIAESRRACEDLVGMPVEGFAYPFGDVDPSTAEAARRAGLAFACTTASNAVGPGADLMHLPRVLAEDLDTDEFRREVLRFC